MQKKQVCFLEKIARRVILICSMNIEKFKSKNLLFRQDSKYTFFLRLLQ